jgi:hypothetical protein
LWKYKRTIILDFIAINTILKFEKTWLKDTQVIELKMKNNDIVPLGGFDGRVINIYINIQ